MTRRQRIASLTLSLLLLGANLIALNYLLAGSSAARLDLTEEGIYSITPATKSAWLAGPVCISGWTSAIGDSLAALEYGRMV